MGAYTLELSNGLTTYIFDGSAHLMPIFKPRITYERNFDVLPSVLRAEIETWDLRGFVFRDATASNLTIDLETLAALLRNKDAPIASAVLKNGGVAVRTLALVSAGGAQVDVYATELDGGYDNEPGQWVNHWKGDLVVVGRRLMSSGNVVALKQELEDSYNEVGLQTQTLTGEIEVTPGTDVEAYVQANLALASLGAAFVFTTGGASAGLANIDVTVQNRPSNTKASFRSQQVQRGNAIPSTALDFQKGQSFSDGAGGRVTTYRAVAKSSTIAKALTAARTVKPAGVQFSAETQDSDSLTATATYTVRDPLPAQSSFYNLASAITITRRVTIRGGGQPRIFDPVPGFDPYETKGAKQTIRVTERTEMRCTSVLGLDDVPLPEPLYPDEFLQPDECEEDGPARLEKGESEFSDLWSRGCTRVYEFANADKLDASELFSRMTRPEGYTGDLDIERWANK